MSDSQGFLTKHDLALLTKRTKYKAQCRVLERMGIRFTKHPEGAPIVTWEAVKNVGRQAAPQPQPEPNFDVLTKARLVK